MLEITNIFISALREMRACDVEANLGVSGAPSGQSAVGELLIGATLLVEHPTLIRVASEETIFEGAAKNGHSGVWSGVDVVGEDVGVDARSSGLVVDYVVLAAHASDLEFPAARITRLDPDDTGDWRVGPEVTYLGSVLAASDVEIEVRALSSFAKLGNGYASSNPSHNAVFGETKFVLDGLYSSIAVGAPVVVEVDGVEYFGTRVKSSSPTEISPVEGVVVPATELQLHDSTNQLGNLAAGQIRVWFDSRKAGTLERIPTKTVKKKDFLNKPVPISLPKDTLLPAEDTHILIQDAEDKVVRAKGSGQLDGDTPKITITELLQEFADDEELVKPITFLWGLTKVTRGQSVYRELIGSGDAMSRWQSFRLAKSPLTYVADPSAPGGRRPEIDVYVNGLKWRRAQSFYKATPRDEIYVVRHDAEHNTFIQFGDGELGKRLPTGKNNVVATYRHGVGGNVEANTITDLFRPIPGVESVTNPLPATGGEDPPTEKEAREKAIQSTRVLGRLVSLPDFEVEAARYGGVIRARARWVWDEAGEDAIVRVWIICTDDGDPSADLRTYLMGMAEPGVRVQVCLASKYTGALELELELDPNYLPEEVYAAVDARLFDEFDGLLVPRNVPIGGAFHRSELYGAIHEIPGVLHVAGVFVDGVAMDDYITLGEGQYLAIAYPETV